MEISSPRSPLLHPPTHRDTPPRPLSREEMSQGEEGKGEGRECAIKGLSACLVRRSEAFSPTDLREMKAPWAVSDSRAGEGTRESGEEGGGRGEGLKELSRHKDTSPLSFLWSAESNLPTSITLKSVEAALIVLHFPQPQDFYGNVKE